MKEYQNPILAFFCEHPVDIKVSILKYMPSKAGGICSPPATIHHLQNPKWPTESGKGFNPRLLTVPNKNFLLNEFFNWSKFSYAFQPGGSEIKQPFYEERLQQKKEKVGKN